jgi:hypothetical protein
MPETITQTSTVYKFNELNDKAKDNVRQWYAENILDDWYDSVYEGAKMDGEERGFAIEDIRFSGFWSQGDGASWTGSVYLPFFLEWVCTQSAYEPLHHRIVPFIELMKDGWVEQRVDVTRTGFHYVHENTVVPGKIDYEALDGEMYDAEHDDVEAENVLRSEGVLKGASVVGVAQGIDVHNLVSELDDALKEEVRAYCKEIYKRLNEEYDWLVEDEQIEDACEANDWRFTEKGELI